MNKILYLGPSVLSGSETFIGREYTALKAKGLELGLWTIHGPAGPVESAETRALVAGCRVLYPLGAGRLLRSGLKALAVRPLATLSTVGRGTADALERKWELRTFPQPGENRLDRLLFSGATPA